MNVQLGNKWLLVVDKDGFSITMGCFHASLVLYKTGHDKCVTFYKEYRGLSWVTRSGVGIVEFGV